MRFYSTAGKDENASFKEAVLQGFARDGGLFLPKTVPKFSPESIERLRGLSFLELSIELGSLLFQEEFTPKEVAELCESAFNFPLPFISLNHQIHLLELFHGPTLSFKDIGARFFAALLRMWTLDEELTVLVATSGDTGSAIGQALCGVTGTRVYILYPKGKVSPFQKQQLTTIGHNVKALEVDGSFEECQNLLKQAVLDPDLQREVRITTANSINIARLFAQAFYFFYAYCQLPAKDERTVFSIPCGNFGHLVSGILAKRMGLHVCRFLGATNVNNEVPLFMHSGVFRPHESYPTIAVSMDVGNPSNFSRLLQLYEHSLEGLRSDVLTADFTDQQIGDAICEMYRSFGYLLDPHSACAYLILREYSQPGIFLATAHPAKFHENLKRIIDVPIHIPERLEATLKKQPSVIAASADYNAFKELLRYPSSVH